MREEITQALMRNAKPKSILEQKEKEKEQKDTTRMKTLKEGMEPTKPPQKIITDDYPLLKPLILTNPPNLLKAKRGLWKLNKNIP